MPAILNATACPAIVVPPALRLLASAENNLGTGVPVSRTLVSGDSSFASKWNRNAAALDFLTEEGAGCYAVSARFPPTLSVPGSGLSLPISTGRAYAGGPLEIASATSITVFNSVRTWVWLLDTGGLSAVNASLTPPATRCVLLGSCLASGGNITAVDTSGVLYFKGGMLWRQTADAGVPGDTPPASVQFIAKTAGGYYLWTGDAYQSLVSNDNGTATASGGAVTLDKQRGVITSEALTTAAGSDYALTLTNSKIGALSNLSVNVFQGSNTTEGLSVQRITVASGSAVIRVRNTHASAAWNGTIKIAFLVL